MKPLSHWPAEHRRGIVGVFTDIDDTLTTDGAITADALQALGRLRDAGLPLVAITGRPVGWSEPFARRWPVDAIVAESGAVALLRHASVVPPGGGPFASAQGGPGLPMRGGDGESVARADGELTKLYYLQDPQKRHAYFARLQQVAQRVLREVPGAVLSRDSPGRETDIAIDHSEFAHLPDESIAQVVRIMREEGMSATVSSIHVNGWFGDHDKLLGARWIVRELYGRALDAEIGQWVYVGDSTNDQLMFEAFAQSVGVANIRRFESKLAHLPRYITQGERGAGFAEVAQALLAERTAAMSPSTAQLGLFSIFASTFFELVGYFMLLPLLLLRLKGADVSTAVAGLFAATGWAGIFLFTPFASSVTQKLGRRPTLWLAAGIPAVASLGFALTDQLGWWFALELLVGAAAGVRWVLAEAVVAEFSPPGQRGRYIGIFETMVGATFVIGPAALVWVGPGQAAALWLAIGFMATGLASSLLIPPMPRALDAHASKVGLRGVWQALVRHPIIMLAGFVGGFFESGITSILPLYGLALGLGAAAAALLVSASGLGSALMMLPVGMLADRWTDKAAGRRTMMVVLSFVTLVATCVVPFVAHMGALAWPIVFLWGGAGGSLYTLAMIDIGSREQGITLVNNTAVLVLTYTLGSVSASSASGALLQWSPTLGFPLLLALVALVGWIALLRTRHRENI